MNPKISLYASIPYDRGSKIRWLLEELQVPYENKWLDSLSGGASGPEYLKINPLGRVPAITFEGQPMIESSAICSFLADEYLEKGLAPSLKSNDRMGYQQWMYFAGTLDTFASRISIIEDIPEGEVKAQKTNQFLEEVKDMIDFLGFSLGNHDYVLNQFTAADICLGYHLYIASLWPEMNEYIESNAKVSAYLARLKSRPAAVQAKVFSY